MSLPSCEAVRDVLPGVLAGSTPPDEARAVLAHVASCADCGAEAELLRLLRRYPEVAPPGLGDRVRSIPLDVRRGTPWRGRFLLAAVLVGLLLGGGLLLRQRTPAVPVAPVGQAAVEDVAAGLDARSLMQALPGTGEDGLEAASASLDDLSEAQLRVLLEELRS